MWRVLVPRLAEVIPLARPACACSQLSQLQALHTTATSQSQQGAGDKGPGIPKPRQPAAAPLQSLAETLAAVAQTSDQPTPATPSTSARITPRTWVWYDARDEVTWQRLELAKQYPHTGVATLNNAHVSPKKINRVLPMIRGLSYKEAMIQLQAIPQKAARYTEELLEYAYDDAREKGLDTSKLVVDELIAGKGLTFKKIAYRAKGRMNIQRTRYSHITVKLRELSVPYAGPQSHHLPPVTYQPPRPEHLPPRPDPHTHSPLGSLVLGKDGKLKQLPKRMRL